LARFPAKSEAYIASTSGLCSIEAPPRSSARDEGHISLVLFLLLHADVEVEIDEWAEITLQLASTAAVPATVEAGRDGNANSDGDVVAGCSRG